MQRETRIAIATVALAVLSGSVIVLWSPRDGTVTAFAFAVGTVAAVMLASARPPDSG